MMSTNVLGVVPRHNVHYTWQSPDTRNLEVEKTSVTLCSFGAAMRQHSSRKGAFTYFFQGVQGASMRSI